jgi:hypothetical protein
MPPPFFLYYLFTEHIVPEFTIFFLQYIQQEKIIAAGYNTNYLLPYSKKRYYWGTVNIVKRKNLGLMRTQGTVIYHSSQRNFHTKN